jgi:integrase
MASITKVGDSWKLRWHDTDGTRRAIGLGAMPKKSAEQVKVRFEELIACKRSNTPLSNSLNDWVIGLSDSLHGKLADNGLVPKRVKRSLGGFCVEFLESRKNVAPATATRDRQIVALLKEFFGESKPIDQITPKDAENWRDWLRTSGNKRTKSTRELSNNTVRRRTGGASQIFEKAVKWKLINENPFQGLEKAVLENPERMHFVDWETMLKVMEAAPNQEWCTLLAFLRLTGCRAPSEIAELRWKDIDFDRRLITLRSPKTAKLGGRHQMRICPLFPELHPYLLLWNGESIANGANLDSKVFPAVTSSKTNIHKKIGDIVDKAGVKRWQKLVQNLRSTRQTELLDCYPIKDVCVWLGNGPATVAKHYAQKRECVMDKAIQLETVGRLEGSKNGPVGVQKGSKNGPVSDRQEKVTASQEPLETPENYVVLRSSGVVETVPEGTIEWAKRDSNPRHPLCKSGALTN